MRLKRSDIKEVRTFDNISFLLNNSKAFKHSILKFGACGVEVEIICKKFS